MTDPAAYDRGFAQLSSHTVEPLLRVLGGRRPRRLLDLGCGTGVVTSAALALGAEVTAVDTSPDMLALVARRHPGVTVRRATLPVLPFGDATFDAVAGNFVVNHVPDTSATLAELHRVLRPGGVLALTWWKADEMTATNVFADAIRLARVPYEPPARPFEAVAAPERFAGLLEKAGFAEVAVETLRWRYVVDAGAWWTDIVEAGGPRFAVIAAQPAETAARIRACYDRLIAPYATEGFPVCAHLAHGTR